MSSRKAKRKAELKAKIAFAEKTTFTSYKDDEVNLSNISKSSEPAQQCFACKSQGIDLVELCEGCGRGYHRSCTRETAPGGVLWCACCRRPMKIVTKITNIIENKSSWHQLTEKNKIKKMAEKLDALGLKENGLGSKCADSGTHVNLPHINSNDKYMKESPEPIAEYKLEALHSFPEGVLETAYNIILNDMLAEKEKLNRNKAPTSSSRKFLGFMPLKFDNVVPGSMEDRYMKTVEILQLENYFAPVHLAPETLVSESQEQNLSPESSSSSNTPSGAKTCHQRYSGQRPVQQ